MTVETFLAWKTKFDKELMALRSEKEREEEKNKKFTGRELFQKDNTLNESDLNFLGDGMTVAWVFVFSIFYYDCNGRKKIITVVLVISKRPY